MTLLRLSTQQSRTGPVIDGVLRLIANHLDLPIFESAPEVRVLCSAAITQPQRSYDPVRLPPEPPPIATLRPLPSLTTDLPRLPAPPFQRAVPITPVDRDGCTCRLLPHPLGPSPNSSRVGIHKFPFEACSGFTRVTARWIAQPPDGDLCHEASIRPVAPPNRSSATRSTDNSLGGTSLHWCYAPSGRTAVEKGILAGSVSNIDSRSRAQPQFRFKNS